MPLNPCLSICVVSERVQAVCDVRRRRLRRPLPPTRPRPLLRARQHLRLRRLLRHGHRTQTFGEKINQILIIKCSGPTRVLYAKNPYIAAPISI